MTSVIHNFRIETPDGTFDMAHSFDVLVNSFTPDQPDVNYVSEKMPGRAGLVLTDVEYGARKIEASCSMFAPDSASLTRNLRKLGAALRKYRTFYLLPDSEPGMRWIVSCGGPQGVQTIGSFAEFSLTFDAWQPYMETVRSDMQTFNTASFTVRNPGDITVDPRALPFVLKYTGASTNLRIRNLTTGDDWRYTGTSNASDVVKIDGVQYTKNNLSIIGDTNLRLITLAPGDNSFVLTGTSGAFNVEFDVRSYYL